MNRSIKWNHAVVAIISERGEQRWELRGVFHRVNNPAMVTVENVIYWVHDGQLHRENGPAVVLKNGTQVWSTHGREHFKRGASQSSNQMSL